VKNIFLRIYKLFGTYYCTAHWNLKNWHIARRIFYVEIVSIILERPWAVAQSVWREAIDEKWKN